MHIALVKKQYSLQRGGAERYCVNLARGLMRLGHQVTVVGERIDRDLAHEVDFVPVPVRHTSSWAKNRSFAANAAAALSRRRYDVSIGLCPSPAVDLYRVTGRVHSHWMGIRYPGRVAQFLQRLNPRHKAILELEREMLVATPSIRRLIVQSQLEKQLLVACYGVPEARMEIVYNGVDSAVFHPFWRAAAPRLRQQLAIPPGSPLLMFVSAVDFEGKGLTSLLEALARLDERRAYLAVIGGGSQKRCRQLATRLGVLHRVRFLPRQAEPEKYLAGADLFVLPSAYEPFPNVNLEALACGTPVVTTATCGGADIIEEGRNGYVVPDHRSVEQIAARIDHFLALPSVQRQFMSERAREVAESLSIERNARRMAQLCAEVLDARRQHPRWTAARYGAAA